MAMAMAMAVSGAWAQSSVQPTNDPHNPYQRGAGAQFRFVRQPA
jgi:hypothetical protein